MTLETQYRVVLQCDWETDDKKYACVVTDTYSEGDAVLSMAAVKGRAIKYFRERGWLIQYGHKHRCPGCVGRRTDTKDRDTKELPDPAAVARYDRFMSINAAPADLARQLNAITGRRT